MFRRGVSYTGRVTVSKQRLLACPHFGRQWFSQKRAASSFTVDNPYTGEIHAEVPLSSLEEAQTLLTQCSKAQDEFWGFTRSKGGLMERQQICVQFIEEFKKQKDKVAAEITNTMGKPLHQSLNEVNTMVERAEATVELSTASLMNDRISPKPGFYRTILRQPKGNVFVIAPWNYPLLCSINSIIPAILCGNSVLLKMSSRTPTIGAFFEDAFNRTDAPKGLLTAIQCDHKVTGELIADSGVHHVVFTGSVAGGHQIQCATAASENKFIDCTLELGGKDPLYVAEDADLDKAVFAAVDGAIYNAGQSCCAVERVYVHESHYKAVCDRAAALFEGLVLGDPMKDSTTLGPMASKTAPGFLQSQVSEAVSFGATVIAGTGQPCVDGEGNGRFFSATLVKDCGHRMSLMNEESFGPVLGVMPVKDDSEALALMNDSEFGLTASIYTEDRTRAEKMATHLETGTVFMNRCDYLDPELAWTGVKNTGKGVSLSAHCFDSFCKLKSLHFKLPEIKRPFRV